MPEAVVRFRAQLALHLGELSQLEVVEAAEAIVRRRHLRLLASTLAGLSDDLAEARRQLGEARGSSNLTYIVETEERVCSLLRQTAIVQRQTDLHIRAFKHAQDEYLARRAWLLARTAQLRRLVVG